MIPTRYARFPQDAVSSTATMQTVEVLGWKPIGANMDSLDKSLSSAAEITSEVTGRASSLFPAGAIHLQHDTLAASMAAVSDIIPALRGFG